MTKYTGAGGTHPMHEKIIFFGSEYTNAIKTTMLSPPPANGKCLFQSSFPN